MTKPEYCPVCEEKVLPTDQTNLIRLSPNHYIKEYQVICPNCEYEFDYYTGTQTLQ